MLRLTSEQFFERLNLCESGKEYLSLIKQVQNEKRSPKTKKDGFDRHHVHPIGLGGDKKGELVKLSAFEHCKAHALLAKAIPCVETLFPVKQMSCGQIQRVSDLDRLTLEDIYKWSELLEQWRLANADQNRGKKMSVEVRKKMSEQRKGKKAWNKGIRYKDIGVVRKPYSEETREKLRKIAEKRRGLIKVFRDGKTIPIRPEELPEYLKQGYIRSGGTTRQKGSVHIHKGNTRKMVSKLDLEKYIKDGWSLGRGIDPANKGLHCSQSTCEKIAATKRGRKIMLKDGIFRYVRSDQVAEYLQEGWILKGYSVQRGPMSEADKIAKKEALIRYWNSPEGLARRERMKRVV